MTVEIIHDVSIDIDAEEAGLDVHVVGDGHLRTVEIIGDGWSLRIPAALAQRVGVVGTDAAAGISTSPRSSKT